MDTSARLPGHHVAGAIERVSLNDLTTLVCDRGPAPMNIAAVLLVEGGSRLDVSDVLGAIATGAAEVPRLRQRLQSAPPGCGRPYWTDDADFDIRRHVRTVRVDGE